MYGELEEPDAVIERGMDVVEKYGLTHAKWNRLYDARVIPQNPNLSKQRLFDIVDIEEFIQENKTEIDELARREALNQLTADGFLTRRLQTRRKRRIFHTAFVDEGLAFYQSELAVHACDELGAVCVEVVEFRS